jgi:hypothetical protein
MSIPDDLFAGHTMSDVLADAINVLAKQTRCIQAVMSLVDANYDQLKQSPFAQVGLADITQRIETCLRELLNNDQPPA